MTAIGSSCPPAVGGVFLSTVFLAAATGIYNALTVIVFPASCNRWAVPASSPNFLFSASSIVNTQRLNYFTVTPTELTRNNRKRHSIEDANKKNIFTETRPFVCFCLFVYLRHPSCGWTKRDASKKFKGWGGKNPGSTSKYTKLGELTIRKIVKI